MSALLAWLAAAAAASPGSARAQETNAPANGGDAAAARRHFERAREEYGHGAYREAIAELEAAHALDPSAKDLVFNLGVVHEKLADIDDALQWFQLYTTMNLTPAERDRADSYIRRLEGAKTELEKKPPGPSVPGPTGAEAGASATQSPASGQPAAEGAVSSQAYGRIDAATITCVAIAGAALAFGTVLAIKAEDDRPGAGFVTGQDGTYADLADRVSKAHEEAVIADVAFGASLAAGITATVLYFARTRDVAKAGSSSRRGPSVSAAPLAGGGVLLVQGSL